MTAAWINLWSRPRSSRRGVWAVAYSSKKSSRYGRSRARRRSLALGLLTLGAGVAALLAVVLVVLPLIQQAPDTVRRTIYPLRYEETIREVSAEEGLEPTFVAAVVYTESRFRPDVKSHRGAYGLMQLLPETASFIQERSGIKGDYRDPKVNLRLGAWYLGYLHERYKGDERLVLAAYNSGEGQVDRWISDEGFDVAKDIPFKETHHYVENVLETQKTYKELYGRNLYRNSE